MNFARIKQYVVQNKTEVIKVLQNFCLTDVILFWSKNPELKSRQQEKWQPVFDWLSNEYDLNFVKTFDLFAPEENQRAAQKFAKILQETEDNELCACYICALLIKSPLLSFCGIKNGINLADALEISILEEKYQNEKWGEDVFETEKRKQIQNDILEVKDFLNDKGNML